MRALRQTVLVSVLMVGAIGVSSAAAVPSTPLEATGAAAAATPNTAMYVPDRLLVGFTERATAGQKTAARRAAKAVSARPISPLLAQVEVWTLDGSTSVPAAAAAAQASAQVRYAEPDYYVYPDAESDDPYYIDGMLWGMNGDLTSPSYVNGSQAGEAWSAGYTGSKDVVVVVLDEGVDISHPDLAANIWTNPRDAADGVDNDGNGYKDDVHGWDFVWGNNSVYDVADGDDHGTHVAGTIGAVGGNGQGVAGVNWNVSLIPVKVLGPSGGTTSTIAAGLLYAVDLKQDGVNIVAVNGSFGYGSTSSTTFLSALNAAGNAGILFVASAGNISTSVPQYPAAEPCTSDCVISVASIDSSGNKASNSAYGTTWVDIGAPGVGIYSTMPGGGYASWSGTSMAAPHVTGALALCASVRYTASPSFLKTNLLSAAPSSSRLAGYVLDTNRLDVAALAALCGPGISTTTLPDGFVGRAYSGSLVATGGTAPYTWSVVQGALPDGLQLDSSTGAISGTPATGGATQITVRVVDGGGSANTGVVTITVRLPVSIATAALPNGTYGLAYRQTLIPDGGVSPYTWSIAKGYLPRGLTLAASTGVISGTVGTYGVYPFDVKVVAADGSVDVKSFSITIPGPTIDQITPLPTGTQYWPYPAFQLTASQVTTPVAWGISSGKLPSGLTLGSSTGIISGTPSVTGNFTITFKATDATRRTTYRTLTMSVLAGPPGPFSKLLPAANATGVATNVKLTWAKSLGANGYLYCVKLATDPSPGCPNDAWLPTGTNLYAYPAGLQLGKTYVWQVRAFKGTAGAITSSTDADIPNKVIDGTGTWRTFTTKP